MKELAHNQDISSAAADKDSREGGPVDFGVIRTVHPSTLSEALDRLDVETARRADAEEALREAEARFRQLSERLGKFLWISDPITDELVYVSPGYEEVWTRTREASYGSAEDWTSSFSRKRKSAVPQDNTYKVAGDDGSVRWIRDRMFPIRDASGQITRMLGIAEDITDARAAQEALASLQQKCRALVTALPDLMVRVRNDGTILEYHPGADAGNLVKPADVTGKTVKELLPPALAAQVIEQMALALRTRQVQTFTAQFLLPDEVRDFEANVVVSADDEVVAIIRDITDRKRLEREILEVSHREQQRIGQDLHDGLGQHLTGITFLAKVLERKLAAKSSEEAKDAAEIGRLVMQALAQTRNLARGLFPVELERNGLVAALEEMASSVERMCKIRCSFRSQDGIVVADNIVATHIFRIAQEAINNSVKHSKASEVEVTLLETNDQIELSVSDNGTGFSPDSKMDGLGLRIMHYRARRIGGTFEIARPDKGGTRVSCAFRKKYESN